MENEIALKQLPDHLKCLDCLEDVTLHLTLAQGLLAGNVFDWGAREVRELLETGQFTFLDAQQKLQSKVLFCFAC